MSRAKTYVGKPCKYGHSGLRYASCGACVACLTDKNAGRRRRGLPPPTRDMPSACECCGAQKYLPGRNGLALDHCQETGRFRGWLCFKCNTAIGKLGDTAAGIKQALDYLLRSEEAQAT